MKKIINLLAVLVMVSLMASCKKNEASLYSCDPVVHQFVAGTSWEGINREELSNYQIDTLIAIFRSVSPENKAAIWRDKMDLLLATESFSADEAGFIQSIRDAITPDLYNDTLLVKPLEDQITAAAALYGWTVNDLSYFFTLPYDRDQMAVYFIMPATTGAGGTDAGTSSCSCAFSWNSCQFLDVRGCYDNGCTKTTWGCGLAFSRPCVGVCGNY